MNRQQRIWEYITSNLYVTTNRNPEGAAFDPSPRPVMW